MKGEILYTGGFNFSRNNASSIRVIENARFFQNLDYKVTILGKLPTEEKSINKNGVEVINIEASKYNFGADITPIKKKVESSKNQIDFIIAYNYPPIAFSKLIKYCKAKNIVLIPDLTEWYSIDGKFTLMKGFRFILNEWRMHSLNRKCKNIIVASTFLKKTYPKANNLLLPFVTTEILNIDSNLGIKRDNLVFVYAGSPGKNFSKDRLDIIIKAFAKVKITKNNFTLKIVGLTKSDLLKEAIIKEDVIKLDDNLICYGRINNELCVNIIKESNFVVFARDINRGNSAGYPTKVFEAFKYGLPVITNKTSDIASQVNSDNGFLIDKADINEFTECFKNILAADIEELKRIIGNCRIENPFSSKYFIKQTVHFFKNIIQ